ncbi:MAG TPA: hypothetical protein VGP31_08195 [Planosporangium sp.]|jgi:membrane associated rhomboid family serine protease|nr:hypothetical protein [Planosporangium sp.]
MDTSGKGIANAVLYGIMLALSLQIGLRLPRRSRAPGRALPTTALVLWLVVAVPSLSQLAFPAIYRALYRDPELIVHHAQWWRVVTSIVVQDGGLSGTIFNLASLAAVAVVSERVWAGAHTLAIFGTSAVVLNALAISWGAVGGGNSGATFALATSIAGLALVRPAGVVSRLFALAATATGVVLIALDDGHGVAIVLGTAIGMVTALLSRSQLSPDTTRAARPGH